MALQKTDSNSNSQQSNSKGGLEEPWVPLSETFEFTQEQIDSYQIDPAISRSVVRAYDIRILPLCFFLYLFSALDRGNIGNAKTDGMDKDHNLTGNEYNNVVTAMSVMFAVMATVGGYLTGRYGAQRIIPFLMTGFGTMATVNAATTNYGGLVTVRFFLGAFEGLFGPVIVIYLSMYYTRSELSKRIAAYYSAAAFSGAFSGLISYGVFQIENSKLTGWQILFILEGGLTVVMAILSYFILPGYPQKVGFLTPRQKEVAVIRLLKDASKKVDSEFSWKEFFAPIKEWKFYIFAVYALCYGTAQSAAATFLPQILGRFGFSAVKTNLYTVAPNFVAVVILCLFATGSDYFRERALFLATANGLVFIGCIILAAIPASSIGVGYFACFLISGGSFVPTAVFHSWHNNNDPSEKGRAFRTGFLTFCANFGSVIASNMFLESDAPKYIHALAAAASLQALAIIIAIGLRTYMVLDNRKRNKAQGVKYTSKDVPTSDIQLGPKSPNFRHFL